MILTGLTGGIGSGKSFIAELFKSSLNVPVYNSDAKAKQLMTTNELLKKQIIASFGDNSYLKNGELNRKYLSETTFKDENLLKKLNSIVHPVVLNDFKMWANNQNHKYLICESAILIENDLCDNFDKIICVIADENIRIERVVKRDNSDRKTIKEIIRKQISDTERIKYADFVINNNKNETVLEQIIEIDKKLWENSQNG